jgi:hypothetical protein
LLVFVQLSQSRSRQVKSRAWFLPAAVWHEGGENAVVSESTPFEEQPVAMTASSSLLDSDRSKAVAADANFKQCTICSEAFEVKWDDDENEWMYVKAARSAQGGIVHLECQMTNRDKTI